MAFQQLQPTITQSTQQSTVTPVAARRSQISLVGETGENNPPEPLRPMSRVAQALHRGCLGPGTWLDVANQQLI